MARILVRTCRVFERLGRLSPPRTRLGHSFTTPQDRTSLLRNMVQGESSPQDYSLPNSSWGSEMMRLHNHYNGLCEVQTEGGEKPQGPWERLPSFNRFIHYSKGEDGMIFSKTISPNARFFTRNDGEPGAAFEYATFFNGGEKRCVCIFQPGHLLEGAVGYVHGGAIATMVDTLQGTLATLLFGSTMTANLNINYRSPILLGNTVLLESSLDKTEGKKIFTTCKVTSSDGSKLHAETTALFMSISGSDTILQPTQVLSAS